MSGISGVGGAGGPFGREEGANPTTEQLLLQVEGLLNALVVASTQTARTEILQQLDSVWPEACESIYGNYSNTSEMKSISDLFDEIFEEAKSGQASIGLVNQLVKDITKMRAENTQGSAAVSPAPKSSGTSIRQIMDELEGLFDAFLENASGNKISPSVAKNLIALIKPLWSSLGQVIKSDYPSLEHDYSIANPIIAQVEEEGAKGEINTSTIRTMLWCLADMKKAL